MPEPAMEPQGIQLGRIVAGDSHPDVVYFLAMTYQGREAVKIGTSTSLKARLRSVSYVAELEDVLLLVPGGRNVEVLFHQRFRECQIPPYAELFWREGQLGAYLAAVPPVSPAAAYEARFRNFEAKSEPKYEPKPEPEVQPGAGPPDTPMGLVNIVRAFILPHGTPEQQRKYAQRLRQDRHRSDRGELPGGLVFPKPLTEVVPGQTELFWPGEITEFNMTRRGWRIVWPAQSPRERQDA